MADGVDLVLAAREAAKQAYAPYSRFPVGAALLFEDGTVVTGANVENASYGLSLCAETVAVAKALSDGRRGGLVSIAVSGPGAITPCGRCRQVLSELAAMDRANPAVLCDGTDGVREFTLDALLPEPFIYD